MLSPDSILANETATLRPGLELIAIDAAALPMAWLSVEVLAQERKSLPLLDEFVLRLVAEGVDTTSLIARVLGIGEDLVTATVADQLSNERLARIDATEDGSRLHLTPVGADVATTMAAVVPKEELLGYAYDLMMERVTAFPRSLLISPQEAGSRGLRRLPKSVTNVSDNDVTAAALNQLISEQHSDEPSIEILACRRVNQKATLYLPVKLLVYANGSGGDVQMAVNIEGEISRSHELKLSQMGGAGRIELLVSGPAPMPDVNIDLARERVPREQVQVLWSQTVPRNDPGDAKPVDREAWQASAELAQHQLDEAMVRAIGDFEFPDLLNQALTDARSRVLITSHTIDLAAGRDEQLVALIEQRLRSGVTVHIAYSTVQMGGRGSLTRRLIADRDRYSNLHLLAIPAVQSELLVWDRTAAIATYPWLSARSDLQRPRRRETGTIIRRAPEAAQLYTDALQHFDG